MFSKTLIKLFQTSALINKLQKLGVALASAVTYNFTSTFGLQEY